MQSEEPLAKMISPEHFENTAFRLMIRSEKKAQKGESAEPTKDTPSCVIHCINQGIYTVTTSSPVNTAIDKLDFNDVLDKESDKWLW